MRVESTNTSRQRILAALTLLAIVMTGAACDRKVVRAKPTAVCVTNVGPEPAIFETPAAHEQRELTEKGRKLLQARDFDQLDKIASELRASKAEWANGFWKLGTFYMGFSELPKEASETRWTNLIAELKAWVKSNPNSITAHTALGRTLKSYAWKARGGGWASTVRPGAWKLFAARLAEARQVFLAATNAPEKCPLWFTG